MHRQRNKKDLKLKPNRSQDKRSSRGAIYENEELRLRTLAITDDVDRGQNDLRKLRKENDHLKREIWNLRDECDKLEDTLRKAINSGNLSPSELPYPLLYLETDNDNDNESQDYDNPDNPDFQGSRKGSLDVNPDDIGFIRTLFVKEDDPTDFIEVLQVDPGQFGCGTPDLEAVTPSPDFGGRDPELIEPNTPTTPVIQITPANSPSVSTPNTDKDRIDSPVFKFLSKLTSDLDCEGRTGKETLTEGGCITVLPRSYEVKSEIHVEDVPQAQKSAVVAKPQIPPPSLPSGIGAEVSDTVSVLNQYGQVVGTVEKQNYKGVDLWERRVPIHLAKVVPSSLQIGGYDVSIQYHCQEDSSQCQLPVNVNVNVNNDIRECPVTSSPVACQISEEGDSTHNQVGRSSSSNPNLELGTSSSPIPTKRQPSASICTATILPDQNSTRLFQKNLKLQKTSSNCGFKDFKPIPETTDPPVVSQVPPNPKKPLSRLLKSSLVAPTSPTKIMDSSAEAQDPNPTGLRSALYRTLSSNRRGSNTSQKIGFENNNVGDKLFLRRNSSSVFFSRYNQNQSHQPLSPMNSNSSSQFDNDNGSRRFGNSGNVNVNTEPLPWCGCWGNGCI